MISRRSWVALGGAVLVLTGLPSCGSEPGIQRDNCFLPVPEVPSEGCSAEDEKRYVDGVMRAHYLFNEQLPELDRADYETASDLLRALIADINPPDRFSYIASRSGEVQFYEEGKVLGLGFNTRWVGDALVLSQVYGSQPDEPPSPASEAGLVRGDQILEIGRRTVQDLVAAGELNAAFGPNEPGLEVVFRLESPSGEVRTVTLVRGFFVFDPVPIARVFDRGDHTIGYVMLRSFVLPAVSQLDAAFRRFSEANVDSVILDLRYNSGGLISVASDLSDLLVGRTDEGGVSFRRIYNEDNADCEEEDVLAPRDRSLPRLERVVAITLGGTASASEQVIAGLEPHVWTRTVGQSTFGKPFGQLGFSYCADQVLRPVTFQTVNEDGYGDYDDGIPPDCAVQERVDGAFGDPDEAMLAAALARLVDGTCEPDKRARGRRGSKLAPASTDRTLFYPGRPPGAEHIF